MTSILLRASKDPFEVVTPVDTLIRNVIANNSGNLIFHAAAHKILATRGTTMTADRLIVDPTQAGRINERYDAYVIPLANAFRASYQSVLDQLTELIRGLRIPVTILGVGAQSGRGHCFGTKRLRPMEGSVRAFVSAVLDHSPSIGVRGEFTYDYLRGLGFRDVEVIGCPSMFLNGDRMAIEKRKPTLERDAALAINVSPYVERMGKVVMSHHARYPDLRYIAQDVATLELLLWGRSDRTGAGSDMPFHSAHPIFVENKIRSYVDPWPWIEALRSADFAFGSRIHGNIAALLAGTPSFVLAHDSRTLELARYFEIPHRLVTDIKPDTDAAQLYAEADYTGLNRGHPARFVTFTNFLSRHGLAHVFAEGEDPTWFDRKVAETNYPPGVESAGEPGARTLGRLKRLDFQMRGSGRIRWNRATHTLRERIATATSSRGNTEG